DHAVGDRFLREGVGHRVEPSMGQAPRSVAQDLRLALGVRADEVVLAEPVNSPPADARAGEEGGVELAARQITGTQQGGEQLEVTERQPGLPCHRYDACAVPERGTRR